MPKSASLCHTCKFFVADPKKCSQSPSIRITEDKLRLQAETLCLEIRGTKNGLGGFADCKKDQTLAAMVASQVAVHQLLLAEGHQLASVDGIDALHASGCAECPAAAALQSRQPP